MAKGELRKILKALDTGKTIDKSACDKSVQGFVFSYQCLVHETDRFDITRGRILQLQNDAAELMRILGLDWNRGLINAEQAESQEARSTPLKKESKAHFIVVTPKSELLPSLPCVIENCSRSYQMLRSLKRHLKDDHKDEIDDDMLKGLTEPVDLVTCKICWKKIRRDKITTHLVSVHKCVKDDPSSVLRGFVSFDRKSWRPLWLPRFVENPPDESKTSIPVDNGKFYYYGAVFEAKDFECSIVESNEEEPLEVSQRTNEEQQFEEHDHSLSDSQGIGITSGCLIDETASVGNQRKECAKTSTTIMVMPNSPTRSFEDDTEMNVGAGASSNSGMKRVTHELFTSPTSSVEYLEVSKSCASQSAIKVETEDEDMGTVEWELRKLRYYSLNIFLNFEMYRFNL